MKCFIIIMISKLLSGKQAFRNLQTLKESSPSDKERTLILLALF